MEDRLRRLTIFISIISVLGFGGVSVYSIYRAHSAQSAVISLGRYLNEAIANCEKDRNSVSCGLISSFRQYFDDSVLERDQFNETSKHFLIASILIPTLSFSLFFGIGWVFTGKLPAFRKGRPMSPSNDAQHSSVARSKKLTRGVGRLTGFLGIPISIIVGGLSAGQMHVGGLVASIAWLGCSVWLAFYYQGD